MVPRIVAVVLAWVGCSSPAEHPTPHLLTSAAGGAAVPGDASAGPAVALADAEAVAAIDAIAAPYATCGARSCADLDLACSGGVDASCVQLGEAYRVGVDAPHDEARARSLFARACEMPSGPFDGCVDLAEIDCRSDDKRLHWAALTTLERACEREHGS